MSGGRLPGSCSAPLWGSGLGCACSAWLQCCSAAVLTTGTQPSEFGYRRGGDTGRALAAGSCLLSVTGDVSVASQAGTLCIIVQLAAITVRATIRVTIRAAMVSSVTWSLHHWMSPLCVGKFSVCSSHSKGDSLSIITFVRVNYGHKLFSVCSCWGVVMPGLGVGAASGKWMSRSPPVLTIVLKILIFHFGFYHSRHQCSSP